MSESADQEFFELVWFGPCGERGAESTFVSEETAFGLGSMTVPPVGKAVMHHPAIAPLGWTRGVSRIERNNRTTNSEFLAAERMIVFGVVSLVAQEASRLKIGGRLPYSGGEVGRVLTGAARGDGAHDQLRGRVKYRRELRPRRMHRFGSAAPPLEVHRGVPRLQARRINCRGAVRIVNDQIACPSAIAASGQQFCKPPFSRSFCSTCQRVEWSGTLASPSVSCSSDHSLTIATTPR